jgi:hypothetical protein
MKTVRYLPGAMFLLLVTALAVPSPSLAATPEDEAEIQTNLAQLPPQDKSLAEAQRFCAVLNDHRLGSMGTPVKLMIDGKPVFVCCAGCTKKATAGGASTVAKVEKLKKINLALASLSPADRAAAEAQQFCAVMAKSPLGSMGTPVKVMIDGQPVFLCCEGCRDEALANPKETLAKIKRP